MAYGFKIRNSLGEDVIDDRRALYVQESGLTSRPEDIGMFVDFGFGDPPFYVGPTTGEDIPTTNFEAGVRFIGTGSSGINGSSAYFMPTPLWPKTAMAFYRPTVNGLCLSLEIYVGPTYSLPGAAPSQGLAFMSRAGAGATPGPGMALDYLVADTALGQISENYGMRIRNAAGNVMFDSRGGLFSIAEVLFVPQSVIGDILDNDTTHDLPLSKPMPGCFISIPYFSAFKYITSPTTGNAVDVRPRIRQVAPDLLRIDRHAIASSISSLRPQYAHDLAIFVARDPFA